MVHVEVHTGYWGSVLMSETNHLTVFTYSLSAPGLRFFLFAMVALLVNLARAGCEYVSKWVPVH